MSADQTPAQPETKPAADAERRDISGAAQKSKAETTRAGEPTVPPSRSAPKAP